MTPIGVLILVVLIIVILAAPRRGALLAIMAGALFLTLSQQVNVLGLNLFAPRFLELAGFIRVMGRREFSFDRRNSLDRLVIILYAFTAFIFTVRSSGGQAYVIGTAVDAFLCYFTFRGLIGNINDFRWFLKAFLVILAPYAGIILIESLTHRNLWASLGEGNYNWTRNGRFRCVGSFRNPDLLGTLGASFLPLYIGLAWVKRERKLACLGSALCLLIVWASNSGGPLCATAVAFIGWGLWFMRGRMRVFRWSMVGLIVLLDLIMKAPVWYLLARLSEITGGDGWHRSYLLDVSFQHIGSWWLAGMPASETADWFPDGVLVSTGAADITNVFISFGLTAGLGAMVLLIFLLTQAFKYLGVALAKFRSSSGSGRPKDEEFLLWGLGVVLAVHIATWFGITYFDQTYVIWFLQLAAISNLSSGYLETKHARDVETTDVVGALQTPTANSGKLVEPA